MKARLCPHCQQPLIDGSVFQLLTRSEFKCANCGESSRLSMFGLNLVLLTFIAIIILAGNRLGYTAAVLVICLISAIVYCLLTIYWIPLLPVSPSYQRSSQKQYKWYQAPVLWIAAFAALLVWFWQSLGLE